MLIQEERSCAMRRAATRTFIMQLFSFRIDEGIFIDSQPQSKHDRLGQ